MTNNDHRHTPPTLSAEEREVMRRSFVAFMAVNPPLARAGILSPFQFLRMPAMAFAVLFLAFGGTAYASEQALPNDFLYPIKTGVIEPLFVTGFATTPEEKVAARTTLIERRLSEAERLARAGEASPELVEQLAAAVEEESTQITDIVETARSSGDVLAALKYGSELETTLEAHGQVFDGLVKDGRGETLSALAAAIESHAASVEVKNEEAETEVTSRADLSEAYVLLIMEDVEEAMRVVLDRRAELEVDTVFIGQARERFVAAVQAYDRGYESRERGEFEEALPQFRYALQAAREAYVLLEVSADLTE